MGTEIVIATHKENKVTLAPITAKRAGDVQTKLLLGI